MSKPGHEADVLVFGGGPAGVSAALAAARLGASVVLVERHGFCGGMATAAGLSVFINYRAGTTDLSAPIYREIVERLDLIGAHYRTHDLHCDVFEPEALKVVLDRMLEEAGVRTLYHVGPDQIRQSGDGTWEVVCRGKNCQRTLAVRCLIDATGDADASRLAGVETTFGRSRDGRTQPMTMVARLGGFDPVDYHAAGGQLLEGRYVFEGSTRAPEIAEARRLGLWDIPRDDIAMFWSQPWDPTAVTVNGTRVHGNATDLANFSEAEAQGRKQAWQLLNFMRRFIPGFSRAFLVATGPATLTESDVLGRVTPEDRICECAYPIDIHDPDGASDTFDLEQSTRYGISYQCLLPKNVEWFLAAGRCISASHEAAGSFRVMPTCSSLGQAAGTAAALAVKAGVPPSDVSPAEVSRRLGECVSGY
jgi:glycine/D-amino acid oxidase-like deaminating enzyme